MDSTDSSVLGRLSNDLAAAVERAGAGTVTVNGRRRLPATGIIWDADGTIVTANHVVERLEAMGHRMNPVDETNNPFGYEFANPTGVMIHEDGTFRAGVDPFRLAEARGL